MLIFSTQKVDMISNSNSNLSEKTSLSNNNSSTEVEQNKPLVPQILTSESTIKKSTDKNLAKNTPIIVTATILFFLVLKRFPILRMSAITNNKTISHIIVLCVANFLTTFLQTTLSSTENYINEKKDLALSNIKDRK